MGDFVKDNRGLIPNYIVEIDTGQLVLIHQRTQLRVRLKNCTTEELREKQRLLIYRIRKYIKTTDNYIKTRTRPWPTTLGIGKNYDQRY